jgi:hypothetical protein
MKTPAVLFCASVLAFALTYGCTKEQTGKFPQTPPDKVVERFYDLLAEGGKLANREALMMVSTKYRSLGTDNFRKWTQSFNKETKFKVVETVLPAKPNGSGDWVAAVKLEVKTPSKFGDYFTTTSRVNLILDKEENKWKIDFMADSIDESEFLNAPEDARADESSGE